MIKGDELTSVEVKILDESTTAISRYRSTASIAYPECYD